MCVCVCVMLHFCKYDICWLDPEADPTFGRLLPLSPLLTLLPDLGSVPDHSCPDSD